MNAKVAIRTYDPPSEPDWDYWPLTGPRGAGKTHRALEVLAESPAEGVLVVVAPGWMHLDYVADMLRRQQSEVTFRRADRSMTLPNGRRVLFRTPDGLKHDPLRGLRVAGALLDSIDLYPQKAERIAAELRVMMRPGRLITTAWGVA